MKRSFPRWCCFVLGVVIASACSAVLAGEQAGPWNLSELKQVPAATWGAKTEFVQEVYFEGATIDGKPTRVFAYVARPESAKGAVPGMVLVHGGGGTAFKRWAELWAKRGYAAIAMDLSGCGPGRKRLDDGGPPLRDTAIFRSFGDDEVDQMWTYQAVAAVVRAHSLLASCEGVDPARIGITGISWGGYLTCIVAGIDDRLKVAVPVYGCGYIYENSHQPWLDRFAKMTPEARRRWISRFDPSAHLPGVRCPILFVNGTNDFAYPLDSYQKSYRLVPGPVDLRIQPGMKHGHGHGWAPKEIGRFVDSVLASGEPLPRLGEMTTDGDRVSAEVTAKLPIVKTRLCYTSDTGRWQTRKWTSTEAEIDGRTIHARLPKERPLVYFLNVTDDRGATASSPHASL